MECLVKFLDYEKKFYEPGQKLRAEVVINLAKTEKISSNLIYSVNLLRDFITFSLTELDCTIWGFAKCKWNEEKGTANAGNVVTNRGHVTYIKESSNLMENSDGNQTELKAGQHKFKVSYVLSSNLPTSFNCKYGSIKYKITVTVDRPWKLKSTFEFPFTIIRPLNLNREGNFLRNPVKDEIFKKFKLDFTTDPLSMSASIPFAAYVPGQPINIQVHVKNQSNTHVKAIKISLKKIVSLNSTAPKRRTKQLTLTEANISTDSVAVQTEKTFIETLTVPSLPPNISNCDIIQVSYELKIKARTTGFSRSPKLRLPITIGSSPLIWPNSPTCRISRKFGSIAVSTVQ
jgi:hypothetical protein